MASSLSVVLPSGGPISTLYGLMVSFVGVLATAASLAEVSGPFIQQHRRTFYFLSCTRWPVCELWIRVPIRRLVRQMWKVSESGFRD